MGLKNFFKKQLSTVIEWKNPSPTVLFEKYASANDEIKNASKLIVAPGQGCVLVYEGSVSDILFDTGIYNLETDNHPFITTLLRARHLFESEHKLALYFFRTTQILNQGWGTSMPVKYLDPTYKIPVQLSANGNFCYQIKDIDIFLHQIIGVQDSYLLNDAREMICSQIVQTIKALLSNGTYSFIQIDHNAPQIAESLMDDLHKHLISWGLQLTSFQLTSTSFDTETYERIGRIAEVTTDVQAAEEAGLNYTELEKLRALRDAANNPGGLAGAGVQFGVGAELAKSLTETDMKPQSSESNDSVEDMVEKLAQMKQLERQGLISNEEFETQKKTLLTNLIQS